MKAEEFYDDHVSNDIETGHMKLIFTDGVNCLFVKLDDERILGHGEAVYSIRRLGGKTVVIEEGYNN